MMLHWKLEYVCTQTLLSVTVTNIFLHCFIEMHCGAVLCKFISNSNYSLASTYSS